MKKFLTIILLSSLFACGNNEQKNDVKKELTPTQVQKNKKPIVDKKERQQVEITMIAKGESMTEIAFEPKSLTIPANARIKLTLKNESGTAGMFHNFVLVELGSGQEIATAGIAAGKENGFVPDDKRVIAKTIMTDIGETTTIEFDSPAIGSYHYICTFPGHYPNMIGRLNVE